MRLHCSWQLQPSEAREVGSQNHSWWQEVSKVGNSTFTWSVLPIWGEFFFFTGSGANRGWWRSSSGSSTSPIACGSVPTATGSLWRGRVTSLSTSDITRGSNLRLQGSTRSSDCPRVLICKIALALYFLLVRTPCLFLQLHKILTILSHHELGILYLSNTQEAKICATYKGAFDLKPSL